MNPPILTKSSLSSSHEAMGLSSFATGQEYVKPKAFAFHRSHFFVRACVGDEALCSWAVPIRGSGAVDEHAVEVGQLGAQGVARLVELVVGHLQVVIAGLERVDDHLQLGGLGRLQLVVLDGEL
eukprot:Transcript_9960.p1 GENE.Transcript_9960~~Transcript_9960.p1  ORF type:complete len:124 (+),score=11.95 Transcript_9960:137-508(+)